MGGRCTEKVDIFSLGVVLWELVTGMCSSVVDSIRRNSLPSQEALLEAGSSLANASDKRLTAPLPVSVTGESPARGRLRSVKCVPPGTCMLTSVISADGCTSVRCSLHHLKPACTHAAGPRGDVRCWGMCLLQGATGVQ